MPRALESTKNKGLNKTVDVQQNIHQQKVKNLELNENILVFDHFAMSPFAKKDENAKNSNYFWSNFSYKAFR